MKFRDGGVARLQHLDEQLGRDDLQLRRLKAVGEAIHRLAPGPEAVARRHAKLRGPGHPPLKGMAVGIGHAGDHNATDALGIRWRHTLFHLGNGAVVAERDIHVP